MSKNPITTTFGLVAAVGVAMVGAYATGMIGPDDLPKWVKTASILASVIGGAGVGYFAQDKPKKNKTPADGTPKRFGLLLVVGLSAALFFNGCAGTSAQRILLVSSSTAAATVNAAYDLWGTDALMKAKAAHPGATPEELVEAVAAVPANQEVIKLYDQWRAANLLWSAANKTLTSGTNSAAVLDPTLLRTNMANIGNKLLNLVAQLTGKAQPVLTT